MSSGYLGRDFRASTSWAAGSGVARLAPAVRAWAIAALAPAAKWDRRHGHLRSLDALDAGHRLLVHHPASSAGTAPFHAAVRAGLEGSSS